MSHQEPTRRRPYGTGTLYVKAGNWYGRWRVAGRKVNRKIAARQALDDPASAEHLRCSRPRLERLLGLLAHRYHARKARYIGAAKARLQALWTAALVNLNPIGRHLIAETA